MVGSQIKIHSEKQLKVSQLDVMQGKTVTRANISPRKSHTEESQEYRINSGYHKFIKQDHWTIQLWYIGNTGNHFFNSTFTAMATVILQKRTQFHNPQTILDMDFLHTYSPKLIIRRKTGITHNWYEIQSNTMTSQPKITQSTVVKDKHWETRKMELYLISVTQLA